MLPLAVWTESKSVTMSELLPKSGRFDEQVYYETSIKVIVFTMMLTFSTNAGTYLDFQNVFKQHSQYGKTAYSTQLAEDRLFVHKWSWLICM